MTTLAPTPRDNSGRKWQLALGVIALGAWVLRALPFLHRHGALGYFTSYDEGVYFSASALLWQGKLPYRDFTFVHPPGALLLWSLASAWTSLVGPASAFALARWMATGVGALNTFLAGRLSLKTWGPVAAVVTATTYAVQPEAITLERGPFIDPLLNLCCLGFATVWLMRRGDGAPRAWRAGVLAGLAVCVKALGGIWGVAALLSRPAAMGWRRAMNLVLAGALTAVTVVGPLAARAPGAFWQQAVQFQLRRPEDGFLDRWTRLQDMLPERRALVVALVLLGLVVALTRAVLRRGEERPVERFVATAYVLTVISYLFAHSYYTTYNAFLTPTLALLAGLGGATLVGWGQRLGRMGGPAVAAAVVLAALQPARELARGLPSGPTMELQLARHVYAQATEDTTVCAFEPSWGLVANRLPPHVQDAPRAVDPYALMLGEAIAAGTRYATIQEAFQAEGSQLGMRALLSRCDIAILGARGQRQLNPASQHWLAEHFTERPLEQVPGAGVWERRDESLRAERPCPRSPTASHPGC
ncbi:DUF2029 domain-containing protein [Corallococcus sp. M34]|uniref:DUF2029 domain-containing protein n=1 Tax=Citreicoccus inhibens TaxID=2849499 RepID=UPI001C23FBE1|nr:DUF2029 domain-containing protein [Citreicoccus inhibens]MBU8896217.1 DUF2029 domain-containing protein [Citreicoccus inhibens]